MTGADDLDWLRHALEGEYRLDEPLEPLSGDDGILRVLARDLSLDRPVVIAALPPALTSPARVETFLRGVRRLARVRHPNLIAIHRAELRGGVPFAALEHVAGETLEARLAAGPIGAQETIRLGRELLSALEASHERGLVHPALRPANVVCQDARVVLTDLGGAAGDDAPPGADLYAVAAMLYRAVAGRAWDAERADDPMTWSGVPGRLRPVLRRALAPHAEQRYPAASAFRRALDRSRVPVPRWAAPAGVAGFLALGVARWLWPSPGASEPPGGAPTELAVLPFEVSSGPASDSLGIAFAQLLYHTLNNVPKLALASPGYVVRWWEHHDRDVGGVEGQLARELHAGRVAHGLIDRRGDSLSVRLTLYDSAGVKTPIPEVRGSMQDLTALGQALALRILPAVAPDLEPRVGSPEELADIPVGALKAFLQGEAALNRDALALAERNYETAKDADSDFALAKWRLANVRRWRRLPYDFDLRAFYDQYGARLRPTDRAVVRAMLEPDVGRRLDSLEAVAEGSPRDAYIRFIYAEELFHRGPLVGRGIELAVREMGRTLAIDSSFAEAYNHIFVVDVRHGQREDARRMLDLRRRVSLEPWPGDADVVTLMALAYDAQFVPLRASLKLRWLDWFADSAELADVARVARLGAPWFDLPGTQIALSRILLHHDPPTDSARASARTGIALGLLTLGRPAAGLAQLDSAVAEFQDPPAEARLQRAEWRAIPPIVGMPRAGDAREWLDSLERSAGDTTTGARAVWALALARLAEGDTTGFDRDVARLQSLAPSSPLGVLLRAIGEGARGRPRAALAISDSVRPVIAVNHPPDPFAGAVMHLLRGDWLAATDSLRAADREWRWYEGSDFEGWSSGAPQAGEIDATFGVYARAKRGPGLLATSLSASDSASACTMLRRVVELWGNAEPVMSSLRARAATRASACRR